MRQASRKFVIIILSTVVVMVVVTGVIFIVQLSATSGVETVSGTIEATEIHLGALLGGKVSSVNVEEGDNVQEGEVLATVQSSASAATGTEEQIRAPLDAVVLEKVFERGEVVAPGSTLLTIANLNNVILTVYVPEDRYGQIYLGQVYPVRVDSFPGMVYDGTVTHIADQAEFTPRNVQTIEGRKATVYAIRLTIPNPNQDLKPGMPADVDLSGK
jgi:multidrug efflux pump subunit AcrA (membrane-fusion protein)